jgi:NADPH2:quinone reductase
MSRLILCWAEGVGRKGPDYEASRITATQRGLAGLGGAPHLESVDVATEEAMLGLVNTPHGTAPIELRDLPEPRPGANEALVEVRAFGLNRGELRSFLNNEEGWRPGQDIAGIVRKQAADGTGPAAGTRIVALLDECGWAERAAVPTHRIAAVPDNVSFAQAAALPVAGITALRTLRHGGPLLGCRVLITGAAGGVGHLAVQLASRSGARVTGVIGRAERTAFVRELGARDVVVGIEAAKGPFALILESAGGTSLTRALQLLEPFGAVVVFGNSSGEPSTISFADFRQGQNGRIQSFFSFTSEPEERFAPDLALLVSLVADDSLKPRIGAEVSWQAVAQVFADLRDRRIDGKAILRVDG